MNVRAVHKPNSEGSTPSAGSRLRSLLRQTGGKRVARSSYRRPIRGAAAVFTALGVFGATVGVVLADAPNPIVPITATAVLNADNSTTVTLTGRWEWPSHGAKDCNDDRYATGWAVDWNDPNQPGNPIAQVNGQGPVIDVGAAAANQYNPADNKTHFYDEPVNPGDPPRCGQVDPVLKYPVGNWGPISHTYAPGVSPAGACVVTYDIHGDVANGPKPADLLAGGPSRAPDNSVEKNGSTPMGNGCFSGLGAPDVSIKKTASVAQGTVGVDFTYTLTAKNDGLIDVAAPVVTDTLPADVTVKTLDPRCTQAGLTVTCTLAKLVAGATAPAINLVVTPTKVGSVTNTVKVTPDDATPDDNTDSVTTPVVAGAVPDVKVDLTAPPKVTLGSNIDYTMKLTNTGSVNANPTVGTNPIPADTTLVGMPIGCTVAAATLTCDAGNLAPGGSKTFNFSVTPSKVGTVVDTATVTPADPTMDDNTDTVSTIVEAPVIQDVIDLGIVKTAPSQVVLGDNLPYTLKVTNNSTVAVSNGTVTDAIPVDTTFVSAGTGCAFAAGSVTCTVGNLAPQAFKSFSIVVKPTKVGTVTNTGVVAAPNDSVPGNNTSTVNTTVGAAPVADLKIVKTVDAAQVTLGADLNYTLTVTNIGSKAVTDGVVSDTLPANVDFVSVGNGCTQAAKVITCNVGALALGASKTFTVKVHPTAIGNVVNTGTVAPTDPTPENNTSTVTSTVVAAPVVDLAIVKTAPAQVNVGENITYTLTVSNLGTGAASNAVVTDALPADTIFVSVTPAACGEAGGTITCNLGSLAAGATAPVITVTVKATKAGTVPNTGVVGPTDSNPGNNTSIVSTVVVVPPVPDLKIVKTSAPATIMLGNNLTYTLTVTNTGNTTVTNGVVTDTLPGNVDLITNDPACTNAGKAITCPVASLAPGASTSLTIVARPTAIGGVSNTAVVGPPDSTPGDNTSTVTNTVIAADLSIVKTAPATATVTAPATTVNVTYGLTVRNISAVEAVNVTVNDVLPAGVGFVSASTGCTFAAATATVTCTQSTLAAGAAVSFSLVVALRPGTITNTATVSPTDATPENNSSTVQTVVSEVLGNTIVRAPATPAAPRVAPAALPKTGGNTGPLTQTGIALVALGLMLLVVTRKPEGLEG